MKLQIETARVAGACGFGGFVGALLALEISTRFQYGSYFWIVGALVGGMVAYVAGDFRRFRVAVVRSYQKTIAWRPNYLYWKAFLSWWVAWSAIFSTFLTIILMLMVFSGSGKGFDSRDAIGVFCYAWPIISLTIGALLAFMFTVDDVSKGYLSGWGVALYGNPIGVTFLLLRSMTQLLMRLPRFVAETSTAVASSIQEIFEILRQFVK